MKMIWLTPFAAIARDSEGGAGGAAAAALAGDSAAPAAGEGAGAAAEGAAPAAEPAKAWYETIADEALRSHAINGGFHQVKGEDGAPRPATAEEIALKALAAHRAAEQRLGVKADELLRTPREGQDPVEWYRANAKALGIPETPEGYEVKRPALPEGMPWDESFEKEALAELHASGAPKHLAQKVVDLYAKKTGAMLADHQSNMAEAQREMRDALAKEWGAETEARTSQASRAFQHFATQAGLDAETQQAMAAQLAKASGGKGLGDARVVKMFAAIAAAMGEDRLEGGRSGLDGMAPMTPAAAQARLDAIKSMDGEFAKARGSNDTKRMNELRAEMGRLARVIGGARG